ncbi:MAG: AAA family ATPase [Gammaproteobacteria bacterium]
MSSDSVLGDWRDRALLFENNLRRTIIGQDRIIRLITVAVFARGHVLLQGDVGVGKTTLLRAVARGLGGSYERVEGTVDLMPSDLVYYTYINEQGRPCVDPGPLVKHGDALSILFFNEINRARPQVHSLLLRVMAERSVAAFNRVYQFPHLQVFADRNRVDKEETFDIPAAACDRFLMEIGMELPQAAEIQRALMFDPRFHDVDKLVGEVESGVLPYRELNEVSATLQAEIQASSTLQDYALHLWQATRCPQQYGIAMDGVDMEHLVQGGASPRGMSMLVRAARVHAWLNKRAMVVPEDLQSVYFETTAHRVFFGPVHEFRRGPLVQELLDRVLRTVAAP